MRLGRPPSSPLRAALRQCRGGLWLVLGFGLIINLLFLVVPLYLIQVYDRVLASQRIETLVMLSLIAGFSLLILGVLEAVRGRLLVRIGSWFEGAISAEVIKAGVRTALGGANVNAQALRDVNTCRHFIIGGIRHLLDLPWMPLFMVAVWLLHPALGLLALGATAVLFVLPVLGHALAHHAARQANTARVANEGLAEQAVRNAEAVLAMGILPRFLHIWSSNATGILTLNRRTGEASAVLLGVTRFARLLAQIGILGVGAYLVIQDELTAGAMIAASILMGRALAPVEQSVGAWNDVVAVRNAHARIAALLDALPAPLESMPVLRPRGELSCDGVWYSPRPGQEPTLRGIHFKLGPGETMAVVGPSASGKTTLCKVLVGVCSPVQGHVRLSGADLHTEWPAEQLGAQIGYVPQDVEFFATSVKLNIARLAQDAEAEAVVAAAEAAAVHEVILALPQGYDTVIGPGGYALPAGQRQRLALARALYGQPRLIVLDEPDSNLDGPGETALAAALRSAAQWRSAVIFVTHNPRLLRVADRILALEHGRVRFCGGRDDVLLRLLPRRAAGRPISGVQRPTSNAGVVHTPPRPSAASLAGVGPAPHADRRFT